MYDHNESLIYESPKWIVIYVWTQWISPSAKGVNISCQYPTTGDCDWLMVHNFTTIVGILIGINRAFQVVVVLTMEHILLSKAP